ncbi:MAG: acetyl-CoA acetyltransferase [Pusillimonas sp.]
MDPGKRACIVGIGETEFTKHGGIMDRSQFQVAAEAIIAAMKDANLRPADIDGFASYSNDGNEAPLMQVALGVPIMRWSSMLWGGGGGGSCGAVSQAVAAVEAGHANAVVVYRGLCQGQTRRFGRFGAGRTHGNFVHPFGLFAPAQMLAMLMQRHMHKYPLGQEHMAEIALNARANANRNPRAIMHGRSLTIDEYYASRDIATPFKLYDCCLESDGACAVIVTTRERARDLDCQPVDILSSIHGSGPNWGSGPLGSQNMPDEDYASTNGKHLADELFARAGVSRQDIDVAQIYDHFSGLVLLALEDYGFCEVGESGDFIADGNIRWPNGGLPINTSGGQLSEAYVHGLNLVTEGVRQLRDTSTSQVQNAQTCFVSGGLGVSPTSALILGRS